jgi:hypothetical protein
VSPSRVVDRKIASFRIGGFRVGQRLSRGGENPQRAISRGGCMKSIKIMIALLVVVVLATPATGSKFGFPSLPRHTPYFQIRIGDGEEAYSAINFQTSEFGPGVKWEFYDRVGYKCVYMYLVRNGQRVARATIQRFENYVQINDYKGPEQKPETNCPYPNLTYSAPASLSAGGSLTVKDSGTTLVSIAFPSVDPMNDESLWFKTGPKTEYLYYEEHGELEAVVRFIIDPLLPNIVVS